LVARGEPDDALRDALAAVLLDPRGGPRERDAAFAALDVLYDDADDGAALLRGFTRRAPCGGARALLDTRAVRAHLGALPPDALASTFKPLIAACDLATESATGPLLARLEAAPNDAPDAAWAVLVQA